MDEGRERVVFVLPTLTGGGAERVVRAVADELSRDHGLTVEVISLLDGPEASHQTGAGVEVRGLGARRVRLALWPLMRELRRRPPSAVMSTLKYLTVGLGLVAWLLPAGTRHVARIANTYSQELASVGAAQRAAMRRLVQLSHRSIDQFVCVSPGVRDDLVLRFGVPAGRCTVIANPVDVDRLEELAARPALELDADVVAARVIFLSVGRLEPQKDHESLLRAFARIRHQLDAALLIAGEGSLRPGLERLAVDLGIADRVRFLGHVDNPYPLFRLSQVLVLSSRFEGLPNVLLEALALGLPCVSTDCPNGPADILVDSRLGVLVPVGDITRLGEAMIEVAGMDADPRFGPDHVRKHHSPAAAGLAYRAVLLGAPLPPEG